MAIYDVANAAALSEIGKVWDVSHAGALSETAGIWDVTSAGATSKIWDAAFDLFNGGNAGATFVTTQLTYTSASVGTVLRHTGNATQHISNTNIAAYVNLTGWNTLNINITQRIWNGTNGGVRIGISNQNYMSGINIGEGGYVAYTVITGTGTFSVDIGPYTGAYYIVFNQAFSMATNGTIDVQANRVWLS